MPPADRVSLVSGAGIVAVLVVGQTLFMGIAVIALDAALVVSFLVWRFGGWSENPTGLLPRYFLGIACFAVHFAEEYATGFYREFPAYFGYEWQSAQFLAFNLAWGVILLVAAGAIRHRIALGYLVLLFFALGGGIMNGIGHLLLAMSAGRYFPGLLSAPLMFVVGIALLRRLYRPARSN